MLNWTIDVYIYIYEVNCIFLLKKGVNVLFLEFKTVLQ